MGGRGARVCVSVGSGAAEYLEDLAEELVGLSDEVANCADNATVQAQRLRIDTRRWVLSKLRPERYGDRLQLTGAGSKDLIPAGGTEAQLPRLMQVLAFLLPESSNSELFSLARPRAEPTPCFSGRQVDELSLTLPPGRNISSLPGGKTVDNAYLHYQSEWKREGQTVEVHREITVTVSFELEARPEFLDGKAFGPPEGIRMLVRPGEFLMGSVTLPVAVCRDEIRAKLAEAIAEIRGDYRSTFALEPLVH
jgi:hypothetical protein